MTPVVKALALVMAAVIARNATPALPSADDARTHTVRAGETLWTIAAARVGDGALWPALYRANRDQIRDPAVLYPGQRLEIPAMSAEAREEKGRERPAAIRRGL